MLSQKWKSKGQKELRICDVLEPVLGSHKLVVMEGVIERDYETTLSIDATTDVKYSSFYQLTRITKERGSLAHDDRLDALAIGVQFFTNALEKDSEVGASEMLEEFLMAHVENPLMRFEDHRQMLMGEVTLQYEADGTTTNYMGW
ncbi:hypothetical protein SAMN05660489_04170 [Pseudomonas sp. LAMO17WK12:I10]|nr:hypothetical protein H160_04258 [Pseudomonas sp. LAMO17WK12:I9]SNY44144.1 hypothetical protein SAMN05660489_04170 [Pseudomonas sp. LAMO17WK12:I10]